MNNNAKKEDRSQINNQNFKKLEKIITKHKASRRKDTIKIRAKINEI